jgi:tetrahydromethanopterin S-methyltransferase subunit G
MENQIFLISLAITLLNLILLIFLILKTKKKGEIEDFVKNAFFFKTTEAFQKGLEKLVRDELEKILLEEGEKIKKATDEFIEGYKKTLIGVYQGIDISGIKLSSEIEKEKDRFSKRMEEIEKEISGKISQIAEFSLKAQAEISSQTKIEISKLKEKSLEAQNLFLKDIKNKIEEFSQNLRREILKIRISIGESLKKRAAETEKEIEDYKNEKLKEIDEKIYRMIGEVAKKTIGKAIDLSTHEELVMEALRKAKKELF